MRIFCAREFAPIGVEKKVVQINHSFTGRKGTIRGMHYQRPPNAEMKIVSCLRGAVFDVLVDIRKGSASFLCWHPVRLEEGSDTMVVVPEGVAHGFQTLRDNTELLYLHTAFYSQEDEGGIRFDDPRVGISWPLLPTNVSDRDRRHLLLTQDFEGLAI